MDMPAPVSRQSLGWATTNSRRVARSAAEIGGTGGTMSSVLPLLLLVLLRLRLPDVQLAAPGLALTLLLLLPKRAARASAEGPQRRHAPLWTDTMALATAPPALGVHGPSQWQLQRRFGILTTCGCGGRRARHGRMM